MIKTENPLKMALNAKQSHFCIFDSHKIKNKKNKSRLNRLKIENKRYFILVKIKLFENQKFSDYKKIARKICIFQKKIVTL